MYLSGEIDGSMIRAYGNKARVLEIIATEGTVLPKDCGYLFKGYENCIIIDLSQADTGSVTKSKTQ